jgi:hypothetical protein
VLELDEDSSGPNARFVAFSTILAMLNILFAVITGWIVSRMIPILRQSHARTLQLQESAPYGKFRLWCLPHL